MASLEELTFGETPFPSAKFNKIVRGLTGLLDVPFFFKINDAAQWVLTLQNSDPTNGRVAIVYAADGVTPLFQVDKNGVRASRTGGAAERVLTTGESATVTAAMLAEHYAVKLAELSGAGASYDFQSIPQTYRHLLLIVYGRSDTASTDTSLVLRFNNDSGANYYHQKVLSAATTSTTSEATAQTSGPVGVISAASATANLMGMASILIPHYTQANRYKMARAVGGEVTALASGGLTLGNHLMAWNSTAAINRITALPGAGSFVADSVATLYGLPS